MVAIVTVYKENAEIFSNYWMPLICKHGPVEFIVRYSKSTDRVNKVDCLTIGLGNTLELVLLLDGI